MVICMADRTYTECLLQAVVLSSGSRVAPQLGGLWGAVSLPPGISSSCLRCFPLLQRSPPDVSRLMQIS